MDLRLAYTLRKPIHSRHLFYFFPPGYPPAAAPIDAPHLYSVAAAAAAPADPVRLCVCLSVRRRLPLCACRCSTATADGRRRAVGQCVRGAEEIRGIRAEEPKRRARRGLRRGGGKGKGGRSVRPSVGWASFARSWRASQSQPLDEVGCPTGYKRRETFGG